MRIENIEIHVGKPECTYVEIGPIKAQVGATTIFSSTPTLDDVNQKLRETAVEMKANAVIDVKYERGISMSSWKALTATGTAVSIMPTTVSAESRLLKLTELKNMGLITYTEFEAKRREIVQSI